METKLIKTEAEYEAALAEIDTLFDRADEDVEARDRAELLALLVEKFEAERYELPEGSPTDVVRFIMDQHDLDQKDLAPYFGAAGRVSDFFRGVRGLSVPTIVALHKKFHVPYDALIDETVERKPRGKARTPRARARRVGRPLQKK